MFIVDKVLFASEIIRTYLSFQENLHRLHFHRAYMALPKKNVVSKI